jgi:hypothetical protein
MDKFLDIVGMILFTIMGISCLAFAIYIIAISYRALAMFHGI